MLFYTGAKIENNHRLPPLREWNKDREVRNQLFNSENGGIFLPGLSRYDTHFK